MAQMTKDVIVNSCKANSGYQNPRLNDQLFLHCRGFMKIQNLEDYVHVKVLWIEQNAISDLVGIEKLQELVSLFAQNNTISSLRNMSGPMMNLRVLNISHNYLTSLEGIARGCPRLETLQASHNHIATLDACTDLWQLAETLTSVDLSFNKMERCDGGATAAKAAMDSATWARGAAVGEVLLSPDSAPLDSRDTRATCVDDVVEQGVRNIIRDDIRVIDPVHVASEHGADSTPSSPLEQADVPVAAALLKPPLTTHSATAPVSPSRCTLDAMKLVHFFQHLPHVSVLYIHGNALTQGMKNYRRTMVLHLPALTYLDERPIFVAERRVTEAWGVGGQSSESAEREAIRAEQKKHLESCVRVLTDRMDSHRATRERLTQECQARQQQEMEEYTLWRRAQKEACSTVVRNEDEARSRLLKIHEDTWIDLEEDRAREYDQLIVHEAERVHEIAFQREVEQVRSQVLDELRAEEATDLMSEEDTMQTPFVTDNPMHAETTRKQDGRRGCEEEGKGHALHQLLRSDSDIMREMEAEIESVLTNLDVAVATSLTRASESKPYCIESNDGATSAHDDPHHRTTSPPHPFREQSNCVDVSEQDEPAQRARTCASIVPSAEDAHLSDEATIHAEQSSHSLGASASRRLSGDPLRESQSQNKLYEQFALWENRKLSLNGT